MQIKSATKIFITILFTALVLSNGAFSQVEKTKKVFIAPLNIELFLAGNFGEVRSNHFHSGIDLKTGGHTGEPVLAVSDGYVSRIKIQAGGYGNALYITHPNGYTSVYGHLEKLDKKLESYVRDQQYRLESFGVDLFPKAGLFSFKEGDIIALSGNSGSSQGPHLHFELRDSQTENPLNPLLFPFKILDTRPPVIYSISFYSLNGRNGLKKPIRYEVSGSNGKYYINSKQPIKLDETFGVGIETLDFLNGSSNKCGVYSIKMFVDDELYFNSEISEFSFAETRYINTFVDYAEYMDNSRSLYKTFIEQNNPLSILQFAKNKGVIDLKDNDAHEILLEVGDAAGNLSRVEFSIMKDSSKSLLEAEQLPLYSAYFPYAETNSFEEGKIKILMPSKALYNNLYFNYESSDPPKGAYSRLHSVHNPSVPLHKSYQIKIIPDFLPDELKPFALIALIGKNNNSSIGGKWEGDYLISSTRTFGNYAIMVDTIPPEIKPRNFKTGSDLTTAKEIRFTISDDFSGIASYRGEIDGEWVLFEWDPKNRLLVHDLTYRPLDKSVPHFLTLIVKDGIGNTKKYTTEIK